MLDVGGGPACLTKNHWNYKSDASRKEKGTNPLHQILCTGFLYCKRFAVTPCNGEYSF